MVWENVPGALSSNKGEDFRRVLEEICRVCDESVVIPRPEKGKWKPAGAIMGDDYSVAWRVLDARWFGVPQRRKRIALVADFRGRSAPEILLVEESLRRDFETFSDERQAVATNSDTSIGTTNDGVDNLAMGFPLYFRPENTRVYEEVATTLCNGTRAGHCNGVIIQENSNE